LTNDIRTRIFVACKSKYFFPNGLKLRGIPSVFYQHFLKRNAKPAPAAPSRNEKKRATEAARFSNTQRSRELSAADSTNRPTNKENSEP
jgi:hypothetical protein